MKILNETPFASEALPSYGPGGKPILAIIVKGTFDILPGQPARLGAAQMPMFYGDQLYDEKQGGSAKFESDVAPFKRRADVVLVGKAHAPGGRMVQVLDVSLRVGPLKKIIRVFGDRRWDSSSRLFPDLPSVPQPFREMDLIYERAFGGIDQEGGGWCRENPVGRGFISEKAKRVPDGTLLPNLEDPKSLIQSWKDHPWPVGFGFYGRAWMPRIGYLGTYDDRWRQERSPLPPEDFRFDFHNAAHPDLQMEGYLQGHEEVELVNLAPGGNLVFQLPGIQLTCSVSRSPETRAEGISPGEEEIILNLDTLCLIPEEKRFYQVWRGLCPIKDLGALEIGTVQIR